MRSLDRNLAFPSCSRNVTPFGLLEGFPQIFDKSPKGMKPRTMRDRKVVSITHLAGDCK